MRDRSEERKKAREEAAKAGATERSAGLKLELLRAQGGRCLYTDAGLDPSRLDEYEIEHIVPRSRGGPDAVFNCVLTTHAANDEKANHTPYEWLSSTSAWDAYVNRVRSRSLALRNKKVQLLISPNGEELAERYTALAETAWIAKLAQTIVGLHFGWRNGVDEQGNKRVTVISGGLTGRIRRKYGLNRILNTNALDEEEAEKKNRDDDRHHALDAMVISFIPGWTRDAKKESFFRFPEGVNREFFEKEIASVKPRNIALDRIVDARIRRDVELFWEQNADATLEEWKRRCASYRLGADGPVVIDMLVTKSKADAVDEYKDVSKDSSPSVRGQFKRGAKHRGYFIYDRPAPTRKEPKKMQVEVRTVFVFESKVEVLKELQKNTNWMIYGFFESGCQVRTQRDWEFQGKKYPADEFIVGSVWANRNAKLWHPIHNEIGPVGLRILLAAGFERI